MSEIPSTFWGNLIDLINAILLFVLFSAVARRKWASKLFDDEPTSFTTFILVLWMVAIVMNALVLGVDILKWMGAI